MDTKTQQSAGKPTSINANAKGLALLHIAVVGAGPAGMAAATRIRFVKRFQALPLKTALFESSPRPGGLLNFGSTRAITGQNFTIQTSCLLQKLGQEVSGLQIPLIPKHISRIEKRGEIFYLYSQTDLIAKSMAVIVATGGRPLANLFTLPTSKLFITYKGLSYLKSIIASAKKAAGRERVAIVSSYPADWLLELLTPVEKFVVILPLTAKSTPDKQTRPITILRANTMEVRDVTSDYVELRLFGSSNHTYTTVRCGAVLADFVTCQQKPIMPELPTGIKLVSGKVPWIDNTMQSSCRGLFFAGDVTCRFASVSTAIADGISAGLAAYRYVYAAIFGAEPSLFAYCTPEHPERYFDSEFPQFKPDLRLVCLAGDICSSLRRFEGRTLQEIASHPGMSWSQVQELLTRAIASKSITLFPNWFVQEKQDGHTTIQG